ncbi:MAG: helix-turn-helix transcriptional regulator [Roseibium sp.]
MLSHEKVWAAIDALALHNGLSASGLARRAGLDPTAFNPSKRIAGDGRPRWPSTESLAKILEATGERLDEFVTRIEAPDVLLTHDESNIPLAVLGDVSERRSFDPSGTPTGGHWDTLQFPIGQFQSAFALEVSGDDLLPLYRCGDIILVAPNAAIRRGDRIVVKPREACLAVYTLALRSADQLELTTIGEKPDMKIYEHSEIEWTSRIIWASQ